MASGLLRRSTCTNGLIERRSESTVKLPRTGTAPSDRERGPLASGRTSCHLSRELPTSSNSRSGTRCFAGARHPVARTDTSPVVKTPETFTRLHAYAPATSMPRA